MQRRLIRWFLFALFVGMLLPVGSAHAEEDRKSFELKNGHVLVGVVIDEGDSAYLVRTPDGETVRVAYDSIEKVTTLGGSAESSKPDESSRDREESRREESRREESRREESRREEEAEERRRREADDNRGSGGRIRDAKARGGVAIGFAIGGAVLMGTGFATMAGAYATAAGAETLSLLGESYLGESYRLSVAAPAFVGTAIQLGTSFALAGASGQWSRSGLSRLKKRSPSKGLAITGGILAPSGLAMLYAFSIPLFAIDDDDFLYPFIPMAVVGMNLLIMGEILLFVDAKVARSALSRALDRAKGEDRYSQRWIDRRAIILPWGAPSDGGLSLGVAGILP